MRTSEKNGGDIKLTKKEIREWTKALRSGEYLQGKERLCADLTTNPKKQKFCCLGVACDLFLDDVWTHDKDSGCWSIGHNFGHNHGAEVAMPPPKLAYAINEALSFDKSAIPGVTGLNPCAALAELNDVKGLNFVEIADIIDRAAGIKTKRR